MYLLNDQLIDHYVRNTDRGKFLDIQDYESSCVRHTYYYFRLGHHYKIRNGQGWDMGELSESNPVLRIPPRGNVLVKSYEYFILSDNIMGIFGQVSDFNEWGLQLVHSPFLDPLFSGNLDLGIWNRFEEPCEIKLKMEIGKIKFFNVSDTYPVEQRERSGKWKARREFRDRDLKQEWVDGYGKE